MNYCTKCKEILCTKHAAAHAQLAEHNRIRELAPELTYARCRVCLEIENCPI